MQLENHTKPRRRARVAKPHIGRKVYKKGSKKEKAFVDLTPKTRKARFNTAYQLYADNIEQFRKDIKASNVFYSESGEIWATSKNLIDQQKNYYERILSKKKLTTYEKRAVTNLYKRLAEFGDVDKLKKSVYRRRTKMFKQDMEYLSTTDSNQMQYWLQKTGLKLSQFVKSDYYRDINVYDPSVSLQKYISTYDESPLLTTFKDWVLSERPEYESMLSESGYMYFKNL